VTPETIGERSRSICAACSNACACAAASSTRSSSRTCRRRRQWFIWGGRPTACHPSPPARVVPPSPPQRHQGRLRLAQHHLHHAHLGSRLGRRVLGVEPAIARDLNLATMSLLTTTSSGRHRDRRPGRTSLGPRTSSDPSRGTSLTRRRTHRRLVRCGLCGNRGTPCHRTSSTTGSTPSACATGARAHTSRHPRGGQLLPPPLPQRHHPPRRHREHTGMLGRQAREDLERRSRRAPHPTPPT
jgi:hypothetical protein